MTKNGRPQILDETKKKQIIALISSGLSMREAARYVRCSASTIANEANRDKEFDEELAQAGVNSQLRALTRIIDAGKTSWRANAWFLERCNRQGSSRKLVAVGRVLAGYLLFCVDGNNSRTLPIIVRFGRLLGCRPG
jgi:IS30 family transposase